MSYFKSNNNTICSNSDLYKRKTFVSNAPVKPVVYNHQDNQFPDLFVATSKGISKGISKSNEYIKAAFATAITASTVASVAKAYEVPPGATQYTFHKATGKTTVTLGKTTVTLGKKSISDLERDKLEEQNYIGETIIKELSYNWKRYKKEYDGLHGPNAYDDLYHTEPIYPYLDEEFFIVE
jgi:hypothetical protein